MGRLLSTCLWEASPAGSLRGQVLAHWCPACIRVHLIPVEKADDRGSLWVWDKNRFRPTVAPVIDQNNGRCHYHLREGRLEFTGLCRHTLAEQIMPLPQWIERRDKARRD